MRTTALLLVPLLLAAAVPPPAAAASASDPAGDERFAPLGVGVPTPCHSPRVDITHASVASDGATVTLRLEVLDFHASLACDGVPAGTVRPWKTHWLFFLLAPEGRTILAELQPDYAGGYVFAYQVGTDNAGEAAGDEVGRAVGNVLTWTVPLSGTRPGTTEAYDYRGVTFQTKVETYERAYVATAQTALLSFSLDDAIPLGPVTV